MLKELCCSNPWFYEELNRNFAIEEKPGAILGKVMWPRTEAGTFWKIYKCWRRAANLSFRIID
jgi:hypothetical protein